MDVIEILRTAAALIGAGSVVVAAIALRSSREQAKTAFEDSLAREYRDIAGTLPPAAFYEEVRVDLDDAGMQAMFRYFDLSNEQLRLIREGRVSESTAEVWKAGILDLMQFETFRAAWHKLRPEVPTDFFTSLSRLLQSRVPADDADDPGASADKANGS